MGKFQDFMIIIYGITTIKTPIIFIFILPFYLNLLIDFLTRLLKKLKWHFM